MDQVDRQILALLGQNARMPVKEIAMRVALTSPAVSARIRRMEEAGLIKGYTVVLRREETPGQVDALISVSVPPPQREEVLASLRRQSEVQQCFHVTGSYSFILKTSCPNMDALEKLITQLQQVGQTSTQIILGTPLERKPIPSPWGTDPAPKTM